MKTQYVNAIQFYLKETSYPIVFCENSGNAAIASTDNQHLLYIGMYSHRHMNNHFVVDKFICL